MLARSLCTGILLCLVGQNLIRALGPGLGTPGFPAPVQGFNGGMPPPMMGMPPPIYGSSPQMQGQSPPPNMPNMPNMPNKMNDVPPPSKSPQQKPDNSPPPVATATSFSDDDNENDTHSIPGNTGRPSPFPTMAPGQLQQTTSASTQVSTTIRITSPFANTAWKAGTVQTVTWTGTTPARFEIQLLNVNLTALGSGSVLDDDVDATHLTEKVHLPRIAMGAGYYIRFYEHSLPTHTIARSDNFHIQSSTGSDAMANGHSANAAARRVPASDYTFPVAASSCAVMTLALL